MKGMSGGRLVKYRAGRGGGGGGGSEEGQGGSFDLGKRGSRVDLYGGGGGGGGNMSLDLIGGGLGGRVTPSGFRVEKGDGFKVNSPMGRALGTGWSGRDGKDEE